MNISRIVPALLAILLAAPLWAQNSGKPLNLKLPPSDLPAASRTSVATSASAPPGVYYGDTSGRLGNTADPGAASTASACDDSTYNKPQVHGSVGMGVMSGSHIGTGTFNTGSVSVDKRYGSCDEPGGGVSMSISVGGARFHDRGR